MYLLSILLVVLFLCYRFFTGRVTLHIDYFLFGVAYYLLLPGVVYEWQGLIELPGMYEWFHTVSDFYERDSIYFLLNTYAWVFSFLFGVFFLRALKATQSQGLYSNRVVKKHDYPLVVVWCVLLFLIVILFYYIFIGRESLFSGYAVEYNAFILGGISSVSVLIYGCFLLILNKKAPVLKFVFFVSLTFACLVLLLSGSRMYVLIPVSGFLSIFLLRYSSVAQRFKILCIMFFFGGFFILVGVLRMPTLALDNVLYIFVAEPVFTSYSLATFWNSNDLPLFSVPLSLLTGFYNFVPSLLWPDKAKYIISLSDMGFLYSAPLGAESIVVSMVGNFGVVGAIVVFFIFGFVLEILFSYRKNSEFHLASYIVILSIIPFMFFRDPFSVTLKVFLTASVILPFALYILSRSIGRVR